MDWLKKLAGYAPDIASAIATGGSSLAVTGLRILGKELLGSEHASEDQIASAVSSATPEQLNELTRINNEFKLEKLRIEKQDQQVEHHETQETIRNGDNSDSTFVRITRPGQAWVSLIAAIIYVFVKDAPDPYILGILLTLPFAYAGLRQAGKWKTADALSKIAIKR